MKRTLTLLALVFAFTSSMLVAQNRINRGTPVVDPGMMAPMSGASTADTIITVDTITTTATIDMFQAERKPMAAPATWARIFNTANPAQSKCDISPIFFNWVDTLTGNPSIVHYYRGLGMEYNVWVTMDSVLYSIPATYTINSITFPYRSVYNRTDGDPDTFRVSVHPRSFQLNGGGNLEVKPTLDTTMFSVDQLLFNGNASNGKILAAPPDASGNYSYYISTAPITININHTVDQLNTVNYDAGFALWVSFMGAPEDSVMMPGWAYEQYTAAPPATQTDVWETSAYYEHYNVYYRYRNHLTGDIVQDYDTLSSGWYTDASLQHFDMKVSVSWDSITIDTTVGFNEQMDGSLTWGEPFPNPSSSTVTVPFRSTQHQPVSLTLVNAVGQTVANREYDAVIAGTHQMQMPVADLAPGIYFLRLQSPGGSAVKRIVVN